MCPLKKSTKKISMETEFSNFSGKMKILCLKIVDEEIAEISKWWRVFTILESIIYSEGGCSKSVKNDKFNYISYTTG